MKKIFFHTLGCKVNYCDTEALKEQAINNSLIITNNPLEANYIVINTCTVTKNADKKSRYYINYYKKKNPNAKIIITGCLASTNFNELKQKNRYVYTNKEKTNLIEILLKKINPDENLNEKFFKSYSTTDRTRAFLKIQDGCDNFCSYCKVPFARGRSKNLPINEVINLINEIHSKGFKEVVLTGINLGDFGKSTNESFKDLLLTIEEKTKIERIRLSSIEVNLLDDDLIEIILNSEKFLPHFHIPLQSASNKILKLMNRKYTAEQFFYTIEKIYKKNPYVGIGLDIIVGFPGEGEKEFLETVNFLNKIEFSYLHVFKYSERENTKAINLPNKVNEKEKESRAKILHSISFNKHLNFIKKNLNTNRKVLVENRKIDNHYISYTDNYIEIKLDCERFKPNEIHEVKLTEEMIYFGQKFRSYELL